MLNFLAAISTAFGGDCTKSAIDNRFRKIKSHAVLIKKALADGRDPFSLHIDEKGSDSSATLMKGGHVFSCISFYLSAQHSTQLSH
jgi:hypothetical protein